MSLAFLDPYRDIGSPIHRLDARVKVVFALGLIVIINATPVSAWPAHLIYLLTVLALVFGGRIALKALLSRSMLALPFVLMASIGLPFVREGAIIASMPLPWGQLNITDVGALRFANVMVKSWLSLFVSITLILTTPFLEIARALRKLGLPPILSSIILLMYRYMFVLVDEGQRLMRAREARSAELAGQRSGGSLPWRARVTGAMIGTLFLRTYERSERIYHAMLARGYTGEIRTLGQRQIKRREFAFGGAGLLLLACVALLARVYG